MPWCPSCSYEYVKGREKCPDCDLPLRQAPGLDEVKFQDRRWVTIRCVPDPVQAELAKAFLESNGCEASIRDGAGIARTILGPGSTSGASVDILVPEEIARHAASLLRAEMNWSEEELAAYMEEHGESVSDDYELEDDREYLESNNVVRKVEEDEDLF